MLANTHFMCSTTDTMVITVDDLSNNASTVLDIVDDSYDTLKDLLSIDFAFVSNLETILENEDEVGSYRWFLM